MHSPLSSTLWWTTTSSRFVNGHHSQKRDTGPGEDMSWDDHSSPSVGTDITGINANDRTIAIGKVYSFSSYYCKNTCRWSTYANRPGPGPGSRSSTWKGRSPRCSPRTSKTRDQCKTSDSSGTTLATTRLVFRQPRRTRSTPFSRASSSNAAHKALHARRGRPFEGSTHSTSRSVGREGSVMDLPQPRCTFP